MLKKRLIISLTFKDGILFRTKNFSPDYRYTKNFVDLWNADEIILIDVSDAGKKLNKKFIEVIKFFIKNCHLPISVGGGILSMEKAQSIFNLGVEKIIMNSSTYYNPKLTEDLVTNFGSSSIVQSIDFKKGQDNQYLILVDNGKTTVNKNAKDYIKHLMKLGTGEILFNSIDNDGGLLGFDINLIDSFSRFVNAPIIIQGGGGSWSHFYDVLKFDCVSAACTQNIYHFTETSLRSAKGYLKSKNVEVRNDY